MEIYPMRVPDKNVLLLEAPPTEFRIGVIERGDQSVPRVFVNHPVVDFFYPAETFQMILPMLDRLASLDGFTGVKAKTIASDVCVKTLFGIRTKTIAPFKRTMDPPLFLELQQKMKNRETHLVVSCMAFAEIDAFARFIVWARDKRFVIIRVSTAWHHETAVRSWPVSTEALFKEIHASFLEGLPLKTIL